VLCGCGCPCFRSPFAFPLPTLLLLASCPHTALALPPPPATLSPPPQPAVPFAGLFRLIDVPVSNCIHSGISNIYVLTQYNATSLNRHLSRAYQFLNGITFQGVCGGGGKGGFVVYVVMPGMHTCVSVCQEANSVRCAPSLSCSIYAFVSDGEQGAAGEGRLCLCAN
jgi:hypothetical protein